MHPFSIYPAIRPAFPAGRKSLQSASFFSACTAPVPPWSTRPNHPDMNVIAEIQRINQAELDNGSVGTSASWHAKYADSAWVFVGNLPMQLTEGDVICVMSQFGEVEDINLVRDEDTGKSKGFAFLKYEDARSCILAVDNLTGSKVRFVLPARPLLFLLRIFADGYCPIFFSPASSSLLLEYNMCR